MATSPETTPTTNAGDGDRGTNSPIRTFLQTQSTSNANGFNVGIDLPDDAGVIGSIRRNPETGELYDSGNLRQNPETGEYYQGVNLQAPTSAGVGQYDDATGGAGTNVNQTAGDDVGSSYGGATQEEYDAIAKAQQGTVTGALNSNSRRQIVPRGNILDRFASYTYRASVYLMNPQEYAQLVRSNKKKREKKKKRGRRSQKPIFVLLRYLYY
jgi:hypothetical protein